MNTIGEQFKVTSFGESHGDFVGCVIDGCPAGIELDIDAIQRQVDRRRTNQTSFATTRHEEDKIQLISGVFEQKTTGSPITILIQNKDAKSSDYDLLKTTFRPNHADYTNEKKYGFRDHRGGGRSSVRITAPLVAAGDIARQLIHSQCETNTVAFVSQIGEVLIDDHDDPSTMDLSQIEHNEVRCPHPEKAAEMIALIKQVHETGDTLGGVITCAIQQVPVGWGEPIFGKLQAKLSHAMLSINSVKGFEYGLGFKSAYKKGSEYNDPFENKDGNIITTTNHSGGIQGGISNGMNIYFRVAFKPISSIQHTQDTIDQHGQAMKLTIGGRHDVCAVPRAVPIIEAYTNLVLADAFLLSKLSTI